MTPSSRAMLRAFLMPTALLAGGWGIAFAIPSVFPFGVMITTFAAAYGTVRSANPHWRAVVRHALLAASAFGYPLFLGGRILPWVVAALHLALVAVAWMPTHAGRSRLMAPQALASGLAIAFSAAATQFFFPTVWREVALATVCIFLLLCAVSMPHPTGWMPSPFVGAMVLVLSEVLVMLRYLPAHWVINGAVLALVFAAFVEQRKTLRTTLASLAVGVLLFGVV